MADTDSSRSTILGLIRFATGLHLIALFILPKTSLGFTSLRPEDVTGAMLIVAMGVLALAGPMALPRVGLWKIGALYLAYFALVWVRDGLNGHPWSVVLWAKEVSYLAFGYLVWRGYRSQPRIFIRLAQLVVLPTIAIGLSQFVLGARGIYGFSPLGHGSSPASSGMVYLGCSIVFFLRVLSGSNGRRPELLLAITLLLVVATGSKIAVLGAVAFYGTYGLAEAWHRRSAPMLVRLGSYAGVGAILVVVATALSWYGLAPSGLARYRGFAAPWDVLVNRGIWWKIGWIRGPVEAAFGAGYAVSHLTAGEFSFGMAMDNQVLYYLVTGGIVGLALYALLLSAVWRTRPLTSWQGRVLRALVVAYVLMGLGGEVLQLSVFGNVFWMVVALCLVEAAAPSAATVARA